MSKTTRREKGGSVKFIWGVIVGFAVVPLLFIAYLLTGLAPAAATDKPFPFESWLANAALRGRISKEAPVRDVSAMSTGDLIAGADLYKNNCASCHGLADQPPPAIANAMFPPAPQLLSPPKEPRPVVPPRPGFDPGRRAGGDFWRVKNGIRLTGMPSFEGSLTDDQIWQIVALLARGDDLPPEVKAELASQPAMVRSANAPAARPTVQQK